MQRTMVELQVTTTILSSERELPGPADCGRPNEAAKMDSIIGDIDAGLISSIEEGWSQIFGALKQHIEDS